MIADPLFPVTAGDMAVTGDEWYTPRWLFAAAGVTFDMDVCAPVAEEFRTCPARRYLTALDDGLSHAWEGIIWCNPPYSNPAPWAARFGKHDDGMILTQFVKRSRWRADLFASSDALTVVNVIFTNALGERNDCPMPILLAARGVACVEALGRVAAADQYARGVYHVRPARTAETTATIPKRQIEG